MAGPGTLLQPRGHPHLQAARHGRGGGRGEILTWSKAGVPWLCGAEIKLKPLSSFYVSKYYDLEAPALLQ